MDYIMPANSPVPEPDPQYVDEFRLVLTNRDQRAQLSEVILALSTKMEILTLLALFYTGGPYAQRGSGSRNPECQWCTAHANADASKHEPYCLWAKAGEILNKLTTGLVSYPVNELDDSAREQLQYEVRQLQWHQDNP